MAFEIYRTAGPTPGMRASIFYPEDGCIGHAINALEQALMELIGDVLRYFDGEAAVPCHVAE